MMSHSPNPMAVTTPLTTVATLGSLVNHEIVLGLDSTGTTVAVNVA